MWIWKSEYVHWKARNTGKVYSWQSGAMAHWFPDYTLPDFWLASRGKCTDFPTKFSLLLEISFKLEYYFIMGDSSLWHWFYKFINPGILLNDQKLHWKLMMYAMISNILSWINDIPISKCHSNLIFQCGEKWTIFIIMC